MIESHITVKGLLDTVTDKINDILLTKNVKEETSTWCSNNHLRKKVYGYSYVSVYIFF